MSLRNGYQLSIAPPLSSGFHNGAPRPQQLQHVSRARRRRRTQPHMELAEKQVQEAHLQQQVQPVARRHLRTEAGEKGTKLESLRSGPLLERPLLGAVLRPTLHILGVQRRQGQQPQPRGRVRRSLRTLRPRGGMRRRRPQQGWQQGQRRLTHWFPRSPPLHAPLLVLFRAAPTPYGWRRPVAPCGNAPWLPRRPEVGQGAERAVAAPGRHTEPLPQQPQAVTGHATAGEWQQRRQQLRL